MRRVNLIVGVVFLAGVAFGYAHLQRQITDLKNAALPANHEHSAVRLAIIRSQISRVESPIVVMGDSIVESALLPPSLCGHPVINAGVGGARLDYFKQNAARIIGESMPAFVVLAAGLNDLRDRKTSAEFASDYSAALKSIKAPVAVATITPNAFDPTEANTFIKSLGYPVIEMVTDGQTTDGAHLTVQGYKLWGASLMRGIKESVICRAYQSSRK